MSDFGLWGGAISSILANRQQAETQARDAAQKIAEQFQEQMEKARVANETQGVKNQTDKIAADAADKSDQTKQAAKDVMDLYGSGLFGKPLGDFAENRGLDRKAYEGLPENPQIAQKRTEAQDKLKAGREGAQARADALKENKESDAYLKWTAAGGEPDAFAIVWAHRPSVYGLHPNQAGQGAQAGQPQGTSPMLPAAPSSPLTDQGLLGQPQAATPSASQTPLLPASSVTQPGEILPGVKMPAAWQGRIDAQRAQVQSRLAYAKKTNQAVEQANNTYDLKVAKMQREIASLDLRNKNTQARTQKILTDTAKELQMTPLQIQALKAHIAATQQNMGIRQQQAQIAYQNFLDKQTNDPLQKRAAATKQAASLNRQMVQMSQHANELEAALKNVPAANGTALPNGLDPLTDWQNKKQARQQELNGLYQKIADVNSLYSAAMNTYSHYNKQISAPSLPRLPGGGLPNNGIGSVPATGPALPPRAGAVNRSAGAKRDLTKMTTKALLDALSKSVK